jgi:hypothetical protein
MLKKCVLFGLAGLILFNACSAGQVKPGALGKESTFREITRNYGDSFCMFSFVMNDVKYDLVTFKDSPSLVVLENSVLYAVLPNTSSPTTQWQACLKKALEKEEFPFGEQGLKTIYDWVKENREKYGIPSTLDGHTSGALDEIGATAIVAATWFIWVPLFLTDATDRMISKKDREKFALINEGLLESSKDYESFGIKLPKPEIALLDKMRSIRAFPLGKSWRFVYIIGFTGDKMEWVSCNNPQVLAKTIDLQKKTLPPTGKP